MGPIPRPAAPSLAPTSATDSGSRPHDSRDCSTFPHELVFTSLHPREGIYCLNPEIAGKAFQPDRSSARPRRAAPTLTEIKQMSRKGLLPDGKASLGASGGQGRHTDIWPAPVLPGDTDWRAPSWNKVGTPFVSGSSLGLFCLGSKLCALRRVESPLWASCFPHCQRRGYSSTWLL